MGLVESDIILRQSPSVSEHRFLRNHTLVELDYPEPSVDSSLNILPQVENLNRDIVHSRRRRNLSNIDLLLSYFVLTVELP